MKKSIFIVTLIITIMTTTVFAANFKDLAKNHWAYGSIAEMTEKGVLVGYPDGTFAPEKSITRAEFAKIMVLALELDEKSEKMDFLDVAEEHWAYKYINTASEYLSAYNSGKQIVFLPNDEAVREDVAVAVVMAAGLKDAKYDLKTLDKFLDKNQISENLKKYVAIAAENNLMNGNADGTFNPKGKLTRAEVCRLMMNTVEELEKIAIADQNKEPEKPVEPEKPIEPEKPVEIVYGDVNEDGDITAKDYALVLGYAAKTDGVTISKQGLKNADVNIDGKVNGTDAIIIFYLSNGKDIKLPAEGITVYGDVNEDGWLNKEDVTKLSNYISGKTALNAQAKKNADFNGDGIINEIDVSSIEAYINTQSDKNKGMVLLTPGKTVEPEKPVEIVYGDVNEDGDITAKDYALVLGYAAKTDGVTISKQGLKNADVNNDGKVNGTDAMIIFHLCYGKDIKLPAEDIIVYGDVNEDGWLNNEDVTIISNYIAGKTSLSAKLKKNADYNGDGKINEIDISSLEAYINTQSDKTKGVVLLTPGKTVEPEKPVVPTDTKAEQYKKQLIDAGACYPILITSEDGEQIELTVYYGSSYLQYNNGFVFNADDTFTCYIGVYENSNTCTGTYKIDTKNESIILNYNSGETTEAKYSLLDDRIITFTEIKERAEGEKVYIVFNL